jgi:hypothetical protein
MLMGDFSSTTDNGCQVEKVSAEGIQNIGRTSTLRRLPETPRIGTCDANLHRAAKKLRVRPLSRPTQFFQPTTARERKLAELRTPEVARKWSFRMNMEMDSFESTFNKGDE